MQKKNLVFLTQAAMIAALYVVLTVVFAPFSFREIQVRISEALTILPAFTPAAVPGLFVGCLLGNILGEKPLCHRISPAVSSYRINGNDLLIVFEEIELPLICHDVCYKIIVDIKIYLIPELCLGDLLLAGFVK